MKPWRSSSQKQYTVYINHWIAFCHQKGKAVFCRDVNLVLDFLVSLEELDLGYSALNTAKSALFALLIVHKHDYWESTTHQKILERSLWKKSHTVPRYTLTLDTSGNYPPGKVALT